MGKYKIPYLNCKNITAPEFYLKDGDRTIATLNGDGSINYWNIMGNGVLGRYEVSGGSKYYYLKDNLGSTRTVMNSVGTVVESHDYYPFGLLLPGRDYQYGSATKEKFTGKELDNETGWYHLGSRLFMSALGRFPSPDRFADKYPSWSPYHYVLNNPIRFTDITGDTVDVDPKLLKPVTYNEGKNEGQTKSLEDMIPAERQQYYFQQWWTKIKKKY